MSSATPYRESATPKPITLRDPFAFARAAVGAAVIAFGIFVAGVFLVRGHGIETVCTHASGVCVVRENYLFASSEREIPTASVQSIDVETITRGRRGEPFEYIVARTTQGTVKLSRAMRGRDADESDTLPGDFDSWRADEASVAYRVDVHASPDGAYVTMALLALLVALIFAANSVHSREIQLRPGDGTVTVFDRGPSTLWQRRARRTLAERDIAEVGTFARRRWRRTDCGVRWKVPEGRWEDLWGPASLDAAEREATKLRAALAQARSD